MNNFSERLNKLHESLGIEKSNFNSPYDWGWIDGNDQIRVDAFDGDESEFKDYLKKQYPDVKVIKVKKLSMNPKLRDEQISELKNFSEDYGVWDVNIKCPDGDICGDIFKAKKDETESQFKDRMKNNEFFKQGNIISIKHKPSPKAWRKFSKVSEKAYMVWDKNSNAPYMYHESDGPDDKSTSMQYLIFKDKTGFNDFLNVMGSKDAKNYELVEINLKNFSNSVNDPKPKNSETSNTPSEVTCPECGKKIIAEFTNLTDEEFGEIAKEAQEITKYPEQYETEADQIHAFSDWLQNSRYKEFCDEAIFKAFCGLKK